MNRVIARKPSPNQGMLQGMLIVALLGLACRCASSSSGSAGRADGALLGGAGGAPVGGMGGTAQDYGLPPGSSIKVLWIGNSLTGAPDAMGLAANWTPMPERLVPMLAELGITMTYGQVIEGGSEFSTHAANPTTMAAISNPTYDIVNFQNSFEGMNDAAAYTAAVRPLYTAAHNAGSVALFEGIWEFGGFGSYPGGGGPTDPEEEIAIEGAAAALPGSFPVQVGHCWQAVKVASPNLIPKMHDDGTHQSVLGEYFNALVYARFFSARSVQNITSVHSLVEGVSTTSERRLLREIVDSCVTIFYRSSTAPTAGLTLQSPTASHGGRANSSGPPRTHCS